MNAQELHIDFDLKLQKINSNITRNIEPEEKDWLLNKEVIKFLNKRTRDISDFKRRGFEEDTKRLKDVKSLIRTVSLNVEQIEESKGRVILPSFNYKDLKASAIYYKDCEESKAREVAPIINIFRFKLPEVITEPIKVELTHYGGIKTLYNTVNLPSTYIGRNTLNLTKSFIIEARKALLTTEFKDIELYYEWYGDTYYENTFFLVSNNKLGNVKVYSDGDSNINPVYLSVSKAVIHTSEKEIKRPIRFISTESADWKEGSFLSGSLLESPTMELEEGLGFVYFPNKTIVKQVVFTYICRPNLIDIYLGTSLNLNTDACEEIVSQTVSFTNALLNSGNYEKYFNETNLIE